MTNPKDLEPLNHDLHPWQLWDRGAEVPRRFSNLLCACHSAFYSGLESTEIRHQNGTKILLPEARARWQNRNQPEGQSGTRVN